VEDPSTKGSYKRLLDFVWDWDRTHFKKAIMTIPYNASHRSMKKYVTESLIKFGYDEDISVYWYTDNNKNNDMLINDCKLLINCITNVIFYGYEKIKKLSKYLIKVAKLYNMLELPIIWELPNGLIIKQSYMQTITSYITPFFIIKLNLILE
jgi:hypothetical protein